MRPAIVTVVGVGVSAPIPLDLIANPPNVGIQVDLLDATVADYAVQMTLDDIYAAGYVPAAGNWFDIGGLVGNADAYGGTNGLALTAVRLNVTVSNGSVRMAVNQAGGLGAT